MATLSGGPLSIQSHAGLPKYWAPTGSRIIYIWLIYHKTFTKKWLDIYIFPSLPYSTGLCLPAFYSKMFVLYAQEYILSLDQSEWNCCLGSPLSNQFPNTKIFAVGDYRNSASIVQLCTSSVRTVRNWSNFVLGEFGRPSHRQYICVKMYFIVGQEPDGQIQNSTPSFHGWAQ